jgi:hypothetical protein
VRENERAAAKSIMQLQQSRKEKLEGGHYSETANMIVSLFQAKQVNKFAEGQ